MRSLTRIGWIVLAVATAMPARSDDALTDRCNEVEGRIRGLQSDVAIAREMLAGHETYELQLWQSLAFGDPLQLLNSTTASLAQRQALDALLAELGLTSPEDRARLLKHPKEGRGLLQLAATARWSEIQSAHDRSTKKLELLESKLAFHQTVKENLDCDYEVAPIDLSGTWQDDWGYTYELRQQGGTVTGSYSRGGGTPADVEGSFNDRTCVFSFTYRQPWNEREGKSELLLSDDGRSMGGVWRQWETGKPGVITGEGGSTLWREAKESVRGCRAAEHSNL